MASLSITKPGLTPVPMSATPQVFASSSSFLASSGYLRNGYESSSHVETMHDSAARHSSNCSITDRQRRRSGVNHDVGGFAEHSGRVGRRRYAPGRVRRVRPLRRDRGRLLRDRYRLRRLLRWLAFRASGGRLRRRWGPLRIELRESSFSQCLRRYEHPVPIHAALNQKRYDTGIGTGIQLKMPQLRGW